MASLGNSVDIPSDLGTRLSVFLQDQVKYQGSLTAIASNFPTLVSNVDACKELINSFSKELNLHIAETKSLIDAVVAKGQFESTEAINILNDIDTALIDQTTNYDNIKTLIDNHFGTYPALVIEIANAISFKTDPKTVETFNALTPSLLPANKQSLVTEINNDLQTYLDNVYLNTVTSKVATTLSLLELQITGIQDLLTNSVKNNIITLTNQLVGLS